MVNRFIKVYARLKKERNANNIWKYRIVQGKNDNFEDLSIFGNLNGDICSNYNFRFCKIFDQNCEQSVIFDLVARPVINSVLEGFNGTIFAYGQTGSGKTYTITGSPKNYNDRGIIPRSIQYIFAHNEKVSNKPVIYISYMEIYNEIGYDLLGTKKKAAYCLEELPKVILLEDKKGECHIRNMRILPVSTEEEAMRLLFLGDTNRTIAETPMNEYSSRSHCIFTIYLTYRNASTDKVKFSKLHLVDLAGSERVHKTSTTGLALSEAKHINLSLHFLQQVILALSDQNRTHIPYRNSMMTNILKDSLCGNCLTVMIANMAINRRNIQETVSTCKFAQRVSVLKTVPIINEISDPLEEVVFLRNRVKELEEKLSCITNKNDSTQQNSPQMVEMVESVEFMEKYVDYDRNLLPKQRDRILTCLKILKEELASQNEVNENQKLMCTRQQEEIVSLNTKIHDKEKEIDKLKNIIDNIPEKPLKVNTQNESVIFTKKFSNQECLQHTVEQQKQQQQKLFEIFLAYSGKGEDVGYYKTSINKKLEIAKLLAQTIEQCQMNITYIRRKLEVCKCHTEKIILIKELEEQQGIYRKALEDMKLTKNETLRLEFGLQQTEIIIYQEFPMWLNQSNVTMSKKNCCDKNNFQIPQRYYYQAESQCNVHNSPDIRHDTKCLISQYTEYDHQPNHCCSNSKNHSYYSSDFTNWNSEVRRSQDIGEHIPSNYPVRNTNLCERRPSSDYINNMSNDTNISESVGHTPCSFSTYPKYYNDQYTLRPIHECISYESNRMICETRSGIHDIEPTREEITCGNVVDASRNASNRTDHTHKNYATKKSKNRKVNLISQLDSIPESDQTNSNLTNSALVTEKYTKESDKMNNVNETSGKILAKNHEAAAYKDLNHCNLTDENSTIIANSTVQMHDMSSTLITDGTKADDQVDILKRGHQKTSKTMFEEGDSESFKEFVSTIELTGDEEIDQEIVNFYRLKFV